MGEYGDSSGTTTGDASNEMSRRRTRRSFVRLLGAGSAMTMVPGFLMSCDDGGIPITPPGGGGGGGTPGPTPVTGVSFDLRTDVGIFRLVHSLEQLEAAFYTAVVASSNFNTFFNAEEREILTDIRDAEVIHREFVRTLLGASALPDLRGSINTTTLNTILSSKANILASARLFESLGVAGLNGAGKYIADARNLLIAGKFVSVEARHLAALRDIAPPSGVNANTAFAGDDSTDSNGRDIKLEAGEVLNRVAATNILLPGTLAVQPIAFAPTAAQGVASADFFTPTP